MLRLRAQPRNRHLTRFKRIFGDIAYLPEGAIRCRTHEPDYSSIQEQGFDWARSVYGNIKKHIPSGIRKSFGKFDDTTHYADANLLHDCMTGRSVPAVLHLINGTPTNWYSKRQATAECATYRSECVAARSPVDQIVDLRYTLMYIGVPIRSKRYLLGDNQSVVTSSTIPNSILSKRHHLPSYHHVREAIGANYVAFIWKDGKTNPADILSKHWEFAKAWPLIKPLLFWRGERDETKNPAKRE